eukprot:c10564_g1_i1.p1 GENE.c10564_g1_i1~~c10564_g1_i1.p1  ORF type:complete len:222 (-),score=60.46 c10564_g1_i1:70-735(-)
MTLKERILGHAKALGIIYDFDSWDEDMLLGLEYDVAIMCIEDEELTHALLRFIDELTIETEDNKHVASKLFKVNYLDPTVRVGFQRVFNALDEEGYGTLTLQSFSRGLTLPPKTCEELFRMSDADNDGEISLEDFFSLMMSSQGSKVSENLKDPSLRETVKTLESSETKTSDVHKKYICLLEDRKQRNRMRKLKSDSFKEDAVENEQRLLDLKLSQDAPKA